MSPRPLPAPVIAVEAQVPEPGSPADILRGLVLAAGGVTEPQAELLLIVLDHLRRIEAQFGRPAAAEAARKVRTIWLQEVA
jgi:hypothetical protein